MPMDEATLLAQLALIQAALTAALANPLPSWKVGQVSFNQSEYLKYLTDTQDAIVKQLRSIPSESYDTIKDGVGALGTDSADYLGEDF